MNEPIEELKSERLKKGLSLQAVSDRTLISVSMLQCLEEGDFRRIGTALLSRNFLQSYCSALGIDPLPFLETYHTKMLACDIQQEGIKRYGIWSKPPRDLARAKVLVIISAGVILMGTLIGWAWYYNWKAQMADSRLMNGNMYSQQDIPTDLTKSVTSRDLETTGTSTGGSGTPSESQPQPQAGETTSASEAATGASRGIIPPAAEGHDVFHGLSPAEPADKSEPHRLEIKTSRQVRVKLRIDGDAPQEIQFKPGNSRTWEVRNNALLEAKNKRGISLTWDGQVIDLPGTSGRPLHLSLPK